MFGTSSIHKHLGPLVPPHLVGEVKTWLERERSYGHGVQKMDLAWKYFQLLSVEKVKLQEKRDELEDGPQKILCINQLERAESQMKSIKEGYKQIVLC